MVVGDGEKMPCALYSRILSLLKTGPARNNLNIGTTPQEIAKSAELRKE